LRCKQATNNTLLSTKLKQTARFGKNGQNSQARPTYDENNVCNNTGEAQNMSSKTENVLSLSETIQKHFTSHRYISHKSKYTASSCDFT